MLPLPIKFRPGHYTFPALFLASAFAVVCALLISAVQIAIRFPRAAQPIGAVLAPWQGLVLFAAAVMVSALLVRRVHAKIAWELILGTTLFLGVWAFLWVVFSGEIGLIVASVVTLTQAWIRRVWIHDVFILLGTAGVALNLAFLFPSRILVLLLVGIALYDTVLAGRAGSATERIAASLVHRGIVPGLLIPGNAMQVTAPVEQTIRHPDAILLGAGDLVLPPVLVAQAALMGILPAVAVSLGILASALWLGSHGSTKPFPAMLPLGIGSLIPFLLLMLARLL